MVISDMQKRMHWGVILIQGLSIKTVPKSKIARCSLYTLRRDLANCNRKREPVFFAFLRERLAIGVIMKLGFPEKEEQAWSKCPMPAQKVIFMDRS